MAFVTIVDDDEDFTSAAAVVLRDFGHQVQIESDPAVAVANMEKRRPDLVIMDVGLPDVDGREAVRILRKNGFKAPASK